MNREAEQLPNSDPAKTRLRLWLKLLKVTRSIEGELRDDLRAQFNTTLPRFDVMAALARHPKGLRMSELSGFLRVSNGNVTGIVDRLVNEGQIIRMQVPGDRRALRVRLTKKGMEEFAKQATCHTGWIDDLLGELDIQKAEQIISQLSKINISASKKGSE